MRTAEPKGSEGNQPDAPANLPAKYDKNGAGMRADDEVGAASSMARSSGRRVLIVKVLS